MEMLNIDCGFTDLGVFISFCDGETCYRVPKYSVNCITTAGAICRVECGMKCFECDCGTEEECEDFCHALMEATCTSEAVEMSNVVPMHNGADIHSDTPDRA